MSNNKYSSFLHTITSFFSHKLQNKQEFIELLETARKHRIINKDSLMMIEGVLKVSQSKVRDVMIPRTKMVLLDESQSLNQIIKIMLDSAHSRYPVLNEARDKVLGILLAKDVLKKVALKDLEDDIPLSKIYRKPMFVPESKRLNLLLRDFKSNRNHMALVVDEYGEFAGLVTMEDVLEQIVGEIEDEHDECNAYINKYHKGGFSVQASIPIEEFNDFFKTKINENMETIGGVVVKKTGYIPKEGEIIHVENLSLIVKKANHRKVETFIVDNNEISK